MTYESELYSIAVVGVMNLAIHHPAWYRFAEVISDQEHEQALQNQPICLPQFAQFKCDQIQIVCLPHRWDVQATSDQSIERLKDVTVKVFDVLLKHTPVQSFGFNFNYVCKTTCENVSQALAKVMTDSQIGPRSAGATSAEFVLRRGFADHSAVLAIAPGPQPTTVALNFNFEYPLKPSVPGQFEVIDIRPTIESRHSVDNDDASEEALRIVEAINRIHQKGLEFPNASSA